MRIILIALERRGGSNHYLSQLANILSEKHEVYCFDLSKEKPTYYDAKVNWVYTPRFTNTDLPNYFSLLKKVQNLNPDVLHVTSNNIHTAIMVTLLKVVKTYPIVTTIHDPFPHKGEENLIRWAVGKIFEKLSDRLIVHGEILKKDMIRKGVEEDDIDIIPHGNFLFLSEINNNKFPEENAILFFGRIEDYKGLIYLIKALPLVLNVVSDCKVIIAGEGDISKFEKFLCCPNFEIHNHFIADEDIGPLFQRSKIVALPYTDASQSGVIPIAYAFSKPVIVTNVGSITEVVKNNVNGIVIEPKNEKVLADAIVSLLVNDKMRMEMGEKGRLTMMDNMSWVKIFELTISSYGRALKK